VSGDAWRSRQGGGDQGGGGDAEDHGGDPNAAF